MDLSTVTSYRVARERGDLAIVAGETYVAGGTWLFSEPQPAVTGLVDLTGLGWAPVEPLADGGLRVAATCTVEQLQAWPWPSAVAPLVRQCADALLMSFKVQHAATVGGNLCLALPAGAMVSLFTALKGQVVVWTPDAERRQPVPAFVRAAGATTLRPGEVVRAVDVPPGALAARYSFRRIALTTYGRTSAMALARRDERGVTLSITGSTPRPLVFKVHAPDDARAAVATIAEWYADPHGASDWRAVMTEQMAAEAVAEVLG